MLTEDSFKSAVKGNICIPPKASLKAVEANPTANEILSELVLIYSRNSPIMADGVPGKVNARRAFAILLKNGYTPRQIREAIESSGMEVSPYRIYPKKEAQPSDKPVYWKLEG